MNSNEINGIINVLKPPGMSSHDVVAHLRWRLKVKKAGHTGTLDPGVAGVLPVCLGKATKVAEYMSEDHKLYRAEVTFGRVTDTQDGFGETLQVQDAASLEQTEVTHMLSHLVGENQQVPPMVSAVKHKGRRLYELARQGIEVHREPRTITIHEVNVIKCSGFGSPSPMVMFDVKCSKGTYVRTLCHDLGQKLGCGAFMSFLVRTGTGSFHISQALTLEEISHIYELGQIQNAILPLDRAVPFEAVLVTDQAVSPILHGNRVDLSKLVSSPDKLRENQLVKLINQQAGCLAVAKVHFEPTDGLSDGNDRGRLFIQPVKVFG
ncbi:MAG: tRNA pseudouridine(55) synthase TruB [Thermincola sp.]|jgi:tRNA pseudouridine55 synthase|nr:tRNA pseudouridine(55) synthase TruB [Thermincola sp.]MDT3701736.1 tRNA pseudouridine(55) synthase TruB [Thermincola sp.]